MAKVYTSLVKPVSEHLLPRFMPASSVALAEFRHVGRKFSRPRDIAYKHLDSQCFSV